MPPVTDRVIAGRYNLVEPIGRGAMGVVWRARDRLLDRDVAIKEVVLNASIDSEERDNAYKRTLREARTAARLSHPGVVTVFDVAEEDGRPWIVMELVPSRSLEAVLADDGPLTPRRACRIGQQILNALATAHAAGVLHRDVKPSNVLIAAGTAGMGQRAVLTDFGIAQFQGDPRLTQTGMVMGSPGFTAPERIRGGAATPASDLWSLGATLYAAVEGVGPYDDRGGPITTMSAIINEDAPLAASAGPLGQVIAVLLRRNPAGRPSAQGAARMFAQVLPLLPDRSAPRRPAPTVPSPAAKVPGQSRAVSATAQDEAEPEVPQQEGPAAENKAAAASDTAGKDDAVAAGAAAADEMTPGEAPLGKTAAGDGPADDGKTAGEGGAAPGEEEPAADDSDAAGAACDAAANAEREAAADAEAREDGSAETRNAIAGSAQVGAPDAKSATDQPTRDETVVGDEAPGAAEADDKSAVNESAEAESVEAESADAESAEAESGESTSAETESARVKAGEAESVKAKAAGGAAAASEADANEPGPASTPMDAGAPAESSAAPRDTPASDPRPADDVVAASEPAPEDKDVREDSPVKEGSAAREDTLLKPPPGANSDRTRPDSPRVPAQPGPVFSANWLPPRLDPPTKPQPEFPVPEAPGYRPAGYGPASYGVPGHEAPNYGTPDYGASNYGAPNYSGPGPNPGGYHPNGYAPGGYNPGGYRQGPYRAGAKRAGRGRLTALILAMVVVAAGIGVAIALLTGPGQARSQSASGTTSGISTPTTNATTAPSQAPAAVRAINAPAAAPADWTTETVLPSDAGTTGGFTIGLPPDWYMKRQKLGWYLENRVGGQYVEVDLTQHKYTDMMAEARYVEGQAVAQGHFPGYQRLSMQPATIRGTAGAYWSFTWTPLDGGTMRVADLLFTLNSQSYAIYMTAPSTDFGTTAIQAQFNQMLRTFQPVLSG